MTQYDDAAFFTAYAKMARSQNGLAAAGEWPQMQKRMPDLQGKRMLDLGCGYGWHCAWAAESGAAEVLGIDVSSRMVEEAMRRSQHPAIQYQVCDLLEYDYPQDCWDFVLSNLTLHYVEDLADVYRKVYHTLKPEGTFLFNIEHPTFTAGVRQEWVRDENGHELYWPVDDYFYPGKRETVFLGHTVEKKHHTLTQILNPLMQIGFTLTAVEEVMPPEEWRSTMPEEMRRPMMLLVKAMKNDDCQ